MIARCTKEHNPWYTHYGGRGITVCERWLSFENFYADMGDRPEGTSLDRIDNNRGYEPGNCRWADKKTQNRNTRANHLVTIDGETKTMIEWAEISGLKYTTLAKRVDCGWSGRDIVAPLSRARGAKNGSAKLTEEKVVRMKLRREEGATYATIGREFGVDAEVARRAIIGRNWTHVGRKP